MTLVPFVLPDDGKFRLHPVIVRARDDWGRSLEFPKDYWTNTFRAEYYTGPKRIICEAPLITLKDSRWVEVTFAIVETETVRFRVKPRFEGRPGSF